jgi:hypothetical protein
MDFSKRHVQHFMASRNAGCVDIMPMTSIWRQFIFEFNMSSPVFGNSNQLWAEIENCWETFMQNEFHVMSSTVGYLWADLINIREQYNAL